MTAPRNRRIAPNVRLPLVPPPGTGIVTPACDDRSDRYPVAAHVGRMLRIGSDVRLCFECGPDGGVYHPDHGGPHTGDCPDECDRLIGMAEVRRIAEAIHLHDGDGSEPPTAAELAAFDADMRRAFRERP